MLKLRRPRDDRSEEGSLSHSAFDYSDCVGDTAGMVQRNARLERDLQADLTNRFGKTLSPITGISLWSGGATTPKLWIDDVSFSNSRTVEHNTLAGGNIGHILRHTETNNSSYTQLHRWFHYDQVGSVMSESDVSGALTQTHYQDAFGNTQASWNTGLWGGDKDGWHHNTKEFNVSTGMVYMRQRWYISELGIFTSSAPIPPWYEQRYAFGRSTPTIVTDPNGTFWGVDELMQDYITDPLYGNGGPTAMIISCQLTLKDHNNKMGGGAVRVPVDATRRLSDEIKEGAKEVPKVIISGPGGYLYDAAKDKVKDAVKDEITDRYGKGAGVGAGCVIDNSDSKTGSDIIHNIPGLIEDLWDNCFGDN